MHLHHATDVEWIQINSTCRKKKLSAIYDDTLQQYKNYMRTEPYQRWIIVKLKIKIPEISSSINTDMLGRLLSMTEKLVGIKQINICHIWMRYGCAPVLQFCILKLRYSARVRPLLCRQETNLVDHHNKSINKILD